MPRAQGEGVVAAGRVREPGVLCDRGSTCWRRCKGRCLSVLQGRCGTRSKLTCTPFTLAPAPVMQQTVSQPCPASPPLSYPSPVVVVLCWYDYPAAPASATALVNDLDLAVGVGKPGGGGLPRQVLGNNPEGAGGWRPGVLWSSSTLVSCPGAIVVPMPQLRQPCRM